VPHPSPIEFVDSVPKATRARQPDQWGSEAAEVLRANPGRIAIIDRAPARTRKAVAITGRSGQIRLGRYGAWADTGGDFAAWVRTVDGETRLYAQYVPKGTAPEPAASEPTVFAPRFSGRAAA